eukprot:scaffold7086_cov62-Phaeocystis_antarctica.AAC.1
MTVEASRQPTFRSAAGVRRVPGRRCSASLPWSEALDGIVGSHRIHGPPERSCGLCIEIPILD